MTNVYERAAAATAALPQSAMQRSANESAFAFRGTPMRGPADAIRRIGPQYSLPPAGVPPTGGWSGGFSGIGGIVSQLLGIIQQLLSITGMSGMFGGAQGPEQYFAHAAASSTGDPHLRFDGTGGNGSNVQAHFDSMSSHADLLDSDSFAGGYQISTTVTQPGSNGITFNQEAAVATNFGGTQVSLDANGNATVTQNGQSISLANGQSVYLGDGETVTRNNDGSLLVRDRNGAGGSIAATLRQNGHGVDVNAQASGVDLGGDLVHRQAQTPPPVMQRML